MEKSRAFENLDKQLFGQKNQAPLTTWKQIIWIKEPLCILYLLSFHTQFAGMSIVQNIR